MPIFGEHDPLVESAIRNFMESPDVAEHLKFLGEHLPPETTVLVAGGAIRNIIIGRIHGYCPPILDIDVFLEGLEVDFRLDSVFSGQHIVRTDLGGIRWQPAASAYAWDIGLLSNFLIIKQYGLPPCLRSLLATLDFNVNAVVYDATAQAFHEHGCIQGIRRKIIDFNTLRMADKLLLVYRILVIRHKIGFALSERIVHFLKNAVDLDTLIHLRGLLIAKQGKITGKAILNDYNRIATCRDYGEYLERTTMGVKS